jgi:carbamate kinase
MTAIGEGMTAEQAKAQVIGKQTKRVREAIAEGEFTIEVIGDVNNDMDMNELAGIVKDDRLVFSTDQGRVYCEVVEENQDTFLLCRTDSVKEMLKKLESYGIEMEVQ